MMITFVRYLLVTVGVSTGLWFATSREPGEIARPEFWLTAVGIVIFFGLLGSLFDFLAKRHSASRD